MKPVYLDNNATTQVAPEVLEEMLPYFHELYGNPSSMHSFGGQVMKQVRKAREQVALFWAHHLRKSSLRVAARKVTMRPSIRPLRATPTKSTS